MKYFNILKQEFPNIEFKDDKIEINDNIVQILDYIKNSKELGFDILLSIIAIDYSEYVELIYPLMSSSTHEIIAVAQKINNKTKSIVNVYPSAHFDECEIYDLFGIEFEGNKHLKRLFLPETWQGHPLRKNYVMSDERLSWNE